MKIALAQINTVVGDLEGNLKKALANYQLANNVGCDVCVFPELTLTGYPPEDLLLRPSFIDDAAEALNLFMKQTGNCVAIIGAPVRDRNSAIVCQDGALVTYYMKQKLPNYGVFDERRYFKADTHQPPIEIAGVMVGISICEDMWTDDVPMGQVARGADLLINLSASPYSASRIDDREQMLITRSRETGLAVVYCNLVGGQDELVFDGGSMMIDPEEGVVARAKQFEEDLMILDTRHPETFRVERKLSHLEEVYSALKVGTRDYVRKTGFHKVIIGLSGGIDSALVAAIAVHALGPEKVLGVLMPSRYSSDGSVADALELAKNLEIETITVPIEKIHADMEFLLQWAYLERQSLDATNADENVQARLRGIILMALSNQTGAMVLTTGNKSEMAMGYATLYGDMAGGFAVIKDVPKTLVFALCNALNEAAAASEDFLVIPAQIISKPPSAELRPNQKDSDTLPDYAVLDKIIQMYVNEDMSPRAIWMEVGQELGLKGLASGELVKAVCRKIDCNEYKRRQAPPGIRISPKAFGKDRRLPISNGYG